MRIEYHESGSEDCPVVVISSFTSEEVADLRRRVADLAEGVCDTVDLSAVAKLEGSARIDLELRASNRDGGIQELHPPFTCTLRPITWGNVEGLLEPFVAAPSTGFQWLDNTGRVKWLISGTGRW
jgi:hypothetical protein